MQTRGEQALGKHLGAEPDVGDSPKSQLLASVLPTHRFYFERGRKVIDTAVDKVQVRLTALKYLISLIMGVREKLTDFHFSQF